MGVIMGGPRSVAAEGAGSDATERVPPVEGTDATERVPPVEGTDATERVPPVRKCPSKNSVLVTRDNRAVILFVTVNANQRQPVFANEKAVSCILAAWKAAGNWLVGRYVIMPDHIHFFCAPSLLPIPDFHRWMAYWKSLVARTFPCAHDLPLWQRGCWDVQMRTVDNYREKWNYIRNNPVRKGLVANADEWPYQGFMNILEWHD